MKYIFLFLILLVISCKNNIEYRKESLLSGDTIFIYSTEDDILSGIVITNDTTNKIVFVKRELVSGDDSITQYYKYEDILILK